MGPDAPQIHATLLTGRLLHVTLPLNSKPEIQTQSADGLLHAELRRRTKAILRPSPKEDKR
jgi:hypothetical protein